MIKVVGVRFKKAGKIYYFDPGEIDIKLNDHVIVETARGVEFGHIVLAEREVEEETLVAPLKEVIRVATAEDYEQHKENKFKAKDALRTCEEKIEKHKLDMKLIDVEYTFDNNKIIFYFTADGRIDFRDLVKDLASIFRTRIELRQIGVRDQAKMLGGVGPCGNVVCCKRCLGEFHPVSIKMAKDQSLSLNPTKISGLCGRLMCCLKYEHDVYEELLDKIPDVGAIVETPMGTGVITDTYTLLEKVRVKVRLEDDTDDLIFFKIDEIKETGKYDKNYTSRKNFNQEEQVNIRELKKLEE